MEDPDQDGSLPFLDTKVTPGPNNTHITTVYRKPTHKDQYLHWNSNHFITAKCSVFNTLVHRAKVVSSNPQSLHKELDHIRKALQSCQFPTWALNKLKQKFECRHYTSAELSSLDNQPNNNHNNNGTNKNNNNRNISIVVPYIQGLREKFKRACNNMEIQVYFKGTNTIKALLMAPKDQDNKLQKSRVYLQIQMPTQKLSRGIHYWVWKSIWEQAKRISQGPIPNPWTQQLHRTSSQPRLLHHCSQGCTGNTKKHQRGHEHLGKWPFFKQELGKILATTHLGTNSARHPGTSTKIKPPPLPPPPTWTHHLLPANHSGGTNILVSITCGDATTTPQYLAHLLNP